MRKASPTCRRPWCTSATSIRSRDDARLYASKLALAGSAVTYREARGMLHGFLRVRLTGPQAKREFEIITDFLSTHLR